MSVVPTPSAPQASAVQAGAEDSQTGEKLSRKVWPATGPGWTRRRFLGACGIATLSLGEPWLGGAEISSTQPAAAFDREVEQFMNARQIPGGALAVVKDRRLVYCRGYGWADREQQIPAQPDSLFRVASLSKPITAVAVLKLAEAGRLDLDARAFELVRLPALVASSKLADPRLAEVTVRQLLQHTGGWDRAKSFDPMFRPRQIARAAQEPSPAGALTVIRYMLGRPLDFAPGACYAYSNFGYCVLGRVLEAVSGQPYERFVQEHVLAPAGITRMRVGASLSRAPGEVRYYMAGDERAESVFPGTPRKVPWPYGGFHLEAMDAHGGWIASAVDLARFAAALDDAHERPLLQPETRRVMHAPPPPPVSRTPDGALEPVWYGCGWSVRPRGASGQANSWHTGSLPGTYSLLVRRGDGLTWAVVFNQRSEDPKLPSTAIDPALHRAADAVTTWPTHDLFAAR
jgi:N-acyl-D-amino-acid deacylase